MEYIDVTPTWESIMPIHIYALRHGNGEAAEEEIMRLARAYDKLVAQVQEKIKV